MEDDFSDLGGEPADDPMDSPAPDLGGGDGGDGGGADDMTLADIAAEIDGGKGGDPDADTEADADVKLPKDLQDFVDKNYNGNADAFRQSLHESRQEATRLHAENAALKAAQGQTPAAAPGPQNAEARKAAIDSAIKVDPDCQALASTLAAINQEIDQLAKDATALATQGGITATKITANETRLSLTTDDAEKARLNTELMLLKAEQRDCDQRFVNADRDRAKAERDKVSLGVQYNRAAKDVIAAIDARAAASRQAAGNAVNTRRHFDTAFTDIAKDFALDLTKIPGTRPGETRFKDPVTQHRYEMTRARISDFMEKRGSLPALDAAGIFEATNRILGTAEKYDGLQRRKPGHRSGPQPKTPVTRPLVTPKVPTPARVATPGAQAATPAAGAGPGGEHVDSRSYHQKSQDEWTADDWRKRNSDVLSSARTRISASRR